MTLIELSLLVMFDVAAALTVLGLAKRIGRLQPSHRQNQRTELGSAR